MQYSGQNLRLEIDKDSDFYSDNIGLIVIYFIVSFRVEGGGETICFFTMNRGLKM